MRRLVVLLLLVNIVFFSLMKWGGELGGGGKAFQPPAALHPEKIVLINSPPAASTPATLAPASSVAAAPVAQAAAVAPVVKEIPAILAASAPAPAPTARAAENGCMEWGEFSGTNLARAEKALAQLKLGSKLAQRTVEYPRGYWIYIPPLKTRADRLRKIGQLKDLGVEDYFVVQEPGRWMNAISLGVFKTEDAAKNFLHELNKKGVRTARVGERDSKLKFTVFVLKHIDAADSAQLAAWQKDYLGSELKSVACD